VNRSLSCSNVEIPTDALEDRVVESEHKMLKRPKTFLGGAACELSSCVPTSESMTSLRYETLDTGIGRGLRGDARQRLHHLGDRTRASLPLNRSRAMGSSLVVGSAIEPVNHPILATEPADSTQVRPETHRPLQTVRRRMTAAHLPAAQPDL
jgi:hypothetical protein